MNKEPAKNALQLFSDFNDNNVRYCHWKSNEHLLPGLTGDTDLDILIDPVDVGKAYTYMIKNNFKRVISHPWKCYSSVEDWIGLDEEQMIQTHLHVHYKLLTGLKNVKDQYFNFNKMVLDNAVIHGDFNIKVCCPDIEYILLLCRIALKRSSTGAIKKVFGESEKKEYEYLLARSSKQAVSEYAHSLLTTKTAEMLIALYAEPDDIRLFAKFRKALIKELSFMQRTTRSNAEAVYFRRWFGYRVSKLFRRPVRLKKYSATGGKLISFIGVDGAGKTTLATFFAKWMSWKIDCRYVYLGTGDGKTSLLNRFKKKALKGKKHSTSGISSAPSGNEAPMSFKRKIRRTAANIIHLSNSKYKYKSIRKINKLVNSGTIVITDRYPQLDYAGIYDGLAIQDIMGNDLLARYNRHLADKERKLFEEMCRFNPDIIIKLVIPVEVSNQRKPCTPKELEIIKRKVAITETLHYKGSQEFIVDSSNDIEITKHEVASILWRYV